MACVYVSGFKRSHWIYKPQSQGVLMAKARPPLNWGLDQKTPPEDLKLRADSHGVKTSAL